MPKAINKKAFFSYDCKASYLLSLLQITKDKELYLSETFSYIDRLVTPPCEIKSLEKDILRVRLLSSSYAINFIKGSSSDTVIEQLCLVVLSEYIKHKKKMHVLSIEKTTNVTAKQLDELLNNHSIKDSEFCGKRDLNGEIYIINCKNKIEDKVNYIIDIIGESIERSQ